MELLENTLFINLDHRTDRLNHSKDQFKLLGINAERVSAVKTKNGCIGCTMSHIKCLKIAKERNYEHVFICEDDITFTDPITFIDSLEKFNDNKKINWDVLIIGGNNCPPYEEITDYSVKVLNCQTTTGYIVKNHYYDKLISNFQESVSKLLSNPHNKREFAIDMYWKKLQQQDNWYLIVPLTVTQYNDYSDIEEKIVNYEKLLLDLDKKWLIEQHNRQVVRKGNKMVFM